MAKATFCPTCGAFLDARIKCNAVCRREVHCESKADYDITAYFVCSVCKTPMGVDDKYCRHCGAKVMGG